MQACVCNVGFIRVDTSDESRDEARDEARDETGDAGVATQAPGRSELAERWPVSMRII